MERVRVHPKSRSRRCPNADLKNHIDNAIRCIAAQGYLGSYEIFTFASYPERVRRLNNRICAINLAERGANFIEIFNFFLLQNYNEDDSYYNTVRIFRGSTPKGGPFTKDLTYSKGFILIYNFLRLAVRRGLLARIPLLFVGKTTLEDLATLEELMQEGILVAPQFVPPQFKDLDALSAWMCFSNFLNRLDLEKIASEYRHVLSIEKNL